MLDLARAYPAFLRAAPAPGDRLRPRPARRRALQHHLRGRRQPDGEPRRLSGGGAAGTAGLHRRLPRGVETRARPVHDRAAAPLGYGRRRHHLYRHRPPPLGRDGRTAQGDGLFRRLGHGGGSTGGICPGADEMTGAPEDRTMMLERVIAAPVAAVWAAWSDPAALPRWWGPDGFSCRTKRIDLRAGGEWVFDMIGPDGTVWPNHHRYSRFDPVGGIAYTLLWGEDGPKHADASARFEDIDGRTRVTLSMTFVTAEEYETAKGFGAVELGLQTLGKLAAHIGAA
ncbi:MAG: SRPBCC domain-containing protein [Rhodobacteraceae bacterium]|nr:SRPBCC domain-containing protein [Paracoccaceae bacterium]